MFIYKKIIKGDDKLILVIRLSKEQNFALISRYRMEIIRAGVEQGIQIVADKLIEENKIRGPSLPKKEK